MDDDDEKIEEVTKRWRKVKRTVKGEKEDKSGKGINVEREEVISKDIP